MRLKRILAAVIMTALMLSGCNTLSLNSSDILAPPRAVGNVAAFQRLIEEDTGGSYTLIYPSSGEYKSGLLLRDLDHNGAEEAIALYTASDGSARIMCAAPESDGYRLIGVGELSSDNVNSLRFSDTDGDGNEDLIVSCDAGAPIAVLNAYMLGSGLDKIMIGEGYTDHVTGDFDGDGSEDILLLMSRSSQNSAKAVLMKYSDGAFKALSEAELDSEVYYYVDPQFCKIGTDTYGAVLNGVLENNEYTTQLLYYDSSAHTLLNPLFVYTGYAETRRSLALKSMDMNDDGIVEFPQCELTEYGKDEDVSSVCYAVTWNKYDAGELAPIPVSDCVLSEQMGCMLKVPDGMISELTARCSDPETMVIYSLGHKGQEPVVGKIQLTLKRYDKSSFDPGVIPEAVLYESSTDVYTYTLANSSVFSDEDVINSFMLIKNPNP